MSEFRSFPEMENIGKSEFRVVLEPCERILTTVHNLKDLPDGPN